MTVSVVGVTEGTDKYLHSESRTIGGTAREEQYVHEGISAIETFVVVADDVSTATANDHLLQLMADGTNYTRIVRWSITETENGPASDSELKVGLYRLSTAGSGGSSITAQPYDTADSYSGDVQSLPTSKGTEGALLSSVYLSMASSPQSSDIRRYTWEVPPGGKPITIGTGTSNGLAWKVIDAVASAAVVIRVELLVTPYL